MQMALFLSVAIMQVTASVTIMQLEVYAALMAVGYNFHCNYPIGSSVANYAGGILCSALCT